MSYPNAALTSICEQLLELGLTQDQIANLAANIPGECAGILENRQPAEPESAPYRNSKPGEAWNAAYPVRVKAFPEIIPFHVFDAEDRTSEVV